MKKVLILTYYWPPSGGAGVQRWLKFVKYLKDFGWEPIVYTAENGEIPELDTSLEKDIPKGTTVLKTPIWEPYTAYKKLIGQKKEQKINAAFLNESKKSSLMNDFAIWIRGNFFIPDARKFWIKPSVKYLTEYILKNKIDAIISSGPPHSMHLIALGLKKNFPNIKWVADFRDPWTNIDFYTELKLTRFADRKHKQLEKAVLKECDGVISVGETLSSELLEINNNNDADKFKVITNGFDQEDLSTAPIEKDDKFSIAHIGTLVKSRNPEVLWKVLKELINENEKFKMKLQIKLVGKIDIHVTESIEKYGLSCFLKRINYLPHNEVIKEQQKSHVNLLLVNNTKNAKGILTGKLFEYLSANVPILAIGPTDGDLARILNQTNAGYISDFNDEKKLKQNITKLFENNSFQGSKTEIEMYSRRNLTKKLSEFLNELVK